MSKIYIDPLNLGPVLIDRDDKSDHEPFTGGFFGSKTPHYGCKHSPESIEKIRKAAYKRAPMSEETRRKIGDIHRNKFVSEETRKKISEKNKRAMKGKKHSPETRKKMSETANLRPRDKHGKFITTL